MWKEPSTAAKKLKSVSVISSIPCSQIRFVVLMTSILAFCACGGTITIQQPGNNATVASATTVTITGSGSFNDLRVLIDGNDVSRMMVPSGSSRADGTFIFPPGTHTITASAAVACSYCTGGRNQASDTKSFVVLASTTQVCARSGGAPIIGIDPSLAFAAQSPGRRFIGYALQNGDGIEIIVDDAPGLPRTSMLVEVDIDPGRGARSGGMVEAWPFCQNGPAVNAVVSDLAAGSGVGVVCNPLTQANNFRSGCTTFSPPMLIDQSTTSELWFRKKQPFGNFDFVEGIDSSMWPVFGGRRVRFIWFR
jgi:hypothetical protein